MNLPHAHSRAKTFAFSVLAMTRDIVWQLRETGRAQIVLDADPSLPSVRAQRHAVAFALHTLLADATRHARAAVRVRLFVFEREVVTLINLPGIHYDEGRAALRHSERLLARQGARLVFSSGGDGTGLRFSLPIASDESGG